MQSPAQCDVFVSSGLVSEEQLSQAMDKQRQLKTQEPIGDLLVSMGLITERDRVRCLGEQWGVPYVDLTEIQIADEVISAVTQELARRFKVIPIERSIKKITLAMKNPLDIFAIDEIRLITGKEVDPVISTEEDIINAISANYRTEVNVTEAVAGVMRDLDEATITLTEGNDGGDDNITIEQLKELSGRSARRPAFQHDHLARHHGQSLGHPHRTGQRRSADSLPRGRHFVRRNDPAQESAGFHHQPHQDHGGHGHLGKARAAGWPHFRDD